MGSVRFCIATSIWSLFLLILDMLVDRFSFWTVDHLGLQLFHSIGVGCFDARNITAYRVWKLPASLCSCRPTK